MQGHPKPFVMRGNVTVASLPLSGTLVLPAGHETKVKIFGEAEN